MNSINELKDRTDTKTLNLVLLSIATAGIYPILWLDRNYKVINNVTKKNTANSVYILWLAVCVGLGLAWRSTDSDVVVALGAILTIASSVLYIVWAFKAKSALEEYALTEHKIDLRMNGIYTFLFSLYYINYCINDLPEVQRKQNILRGTPLESQTDI